MRVLFIDDELSDLELVSRAMSGLSIMGVQDLADARSALRAGRFDAILLDIALPDAIGRSTLHHIVELRELSDAPIIILSGAADSASICAAIEAGADDYLHKSLILGAPAQVLVTLIVNAARKRKR